MALYTKSQIDTVFRVISYVRFDMGILLLGSCRDRGGTNSLNGMAKSVQINESCNFISSCSAFFPICISCSRSMLRSKWSLPIETLWTKIICSIVCKCREMNQVVPHRILNVSAILVLQSVPILTACFSRRAHYMLNPI